MQKVFITGGTRGIGLATVRAFLKRGALVHICGRNAPKKELFEKDAVVFHKVDVCDPQACENALKTAHDTMDGLDVLVNNAGGTVSKRSQDCSVDFARTIVELNMLSCFWMMKAAFSFMQNKTDASIINIASIAADGLPTRVALYGAAKAGVISLTRSLAAEWAPIRVNALVPGPVLTEGLQRLYGDSNYLDKMTEKIPLGRLASMEDIANACVFLASPEASYISGTTLRLDGGGYFMTYEKAKER